jgi:two-component system sensor histidine kinase DegS
MEIEATSSNSNSDEFVMQLQEELKSAQSTLNEVSLTLDQSQNELNRLAQKKASVTAQLLPFQTDATPNSGKEMRAAFNAAMDAQQRLLVSRGQLEKLTEQKNSLRNYKNLLERIISYSKSFPIIKSNGSRENDGISTLVMLINAQESERQRLSRQMHDGPAQALSNFIIQAEIITRMYEVEPTKAKEELDKLKISAMSTFQKIRTYISELRPMMLDDLGLIPTIKKYIFTIKEQTGIEANLLIVGPEKRFEPHLEVYIFRAIQELLGNSIKHNIDNANKLKINVTFTIENRLLKVVIKDNGKGFDPIVIQETSGLGLKLIEERAVLLGGKLNINSSDSNGTEVTLSIPLIDGDNS